MLADRTEGGGGGLQVEVAASDRDEEASLIVPTGAFCSTTSGLAWIRPGASTEATGAITLPMRRLHGLVAVGRVTVRGPVLLKIDVEGAELEVIRGLQRTLGRDRPSILCEILPTGLPGTTESARFDLRRRRQDELLAVLLKDLHYRMQRIAPDGTLVPLETIEPHDRMEWSQYWFD